MTNQTKKISGKKRLIIAISIFWIFSGLLLSLVAGKDIDGFSFSAFVSIFLVFNMPVWLGWLIYWVYRGFKVGNRNK